MASKGEEVLKIKGLQKRFGGAIALSNASITIRAGEIHAFLGENGAGKSTVMKILYGMQRPDGGEIFVNGQQVNAGEECPDSCWVKLDEILGKRIPTNYKIMYSGIYPTPS